MFAALSPMQQPHNPSTYAWIPTRSSPLSPPRPSSSYSPTNMTATIPTQQLPSSPFTFSTTTISSSPSPSPSKSWGTFNPNTTTPSRFNTSPTSNSTSTYAHRYNTTIANPLSNFASKRTYTASSSPSARSVRRNAFLNRIKQDRQNGRFETRAEQLLFMENIAEQREWTESMGRRAEEIQVGLDPELGFEDEMVGESEAEMRALDEYLEQERALEMELAKRMEPDPWGQMQGGSIYVGSGSFSDEEYDDIFMDLADHSSSQGMDMSG